MSKKCCDSNTSVLRYRLSKNSDYQEVKLNKGKYCVELKTGLGGWYCYVIATPPGAPYLCVPQNFSSYIGDFDATAVYTNSGGTAATCPGNRGRTNTYRNGIFLNQPDDVVTINYTFEQPYCQLIVTNNNDQNVFTKKANTVAPSNSCPIEYSFICDSNCAEGYLECKTDNYPGYCCIPCSEIKNEIKAIANQVRSLNDN